MKYKNSIDEFFVTHVAKVRHFGSGEVAKILGVTPLQLHRLLTRHQLTSSGQLGQGKGSRRWFTIEDIYRIATAIFLIKDGFNAKTVSSAVQTLEDEDFYGTHDERGEFSEMGIFLKRATGEPEVGTFRSDSRPELRVGGDVYYALPLDQVTRTIDRRIRQAENKGGI
jgi:DNA-binding transcriptional MerR regulator